MLYVYRSSLSAVIRKQSAISTACQKQWKHLLGKSYGSDGEASPLIKADDQSGDQIRRCPLESAITGAIIEL